MLIINALTTGIANMYGSVVKWRESVSCKGDAQ